MSQERKFAEADILDSCIFVSLLKANISGIAEDVLQVSQQCCVFRCGQPSELGAVLTLYISLTQTS